MLVYGMCECFVIQMFMFVSCMHPVDVLNAAFCMPCSLLMLVEDARATIWNGHTPELVSWLPCR